MPRHYRYKVGYPRVNDDPGGWAEAFASRDFRGTQPLRDTPEPIGAIQSWYLANTGHDPALTYETIEGTMTINSTWLNANNGNGRVSFSEGEWWVERYRCTGTLRLATNNVTISNYHGDSAGALYAFQSRAIDGNATNIKLLHSTLAGNAANDTGATLNFPEARTPNQITLQNVDISGYRAGLYAFGGITAKYCRVHDLHFSEGSHNTGGSLRAGNNHFYRNLIADGNSAAVSWYPEHGPYTNNLVEENIFRLANIDYGGEVILAEKGYHVVQPGETRVLINNLFFRGGNLGNFDPQSPVGGGIRGYMSGFTQVSGNIDRNGNPVS